MWLQLVFKASDFLSDHPRSPGAMVKVVVVSILVGIPGSALGGRLR